MTDVELVDTVRIMLTTSEARIKQLCEWSPPARPEDVMLLRTKCAQGIVEFVRREMKG